MTWAWVLSAGTGQSLESENTPDLFADGLDVGYDRKTGVKNDPTVFCPNNWKVRVVIA